MEEEQCYTILYSLVCRKGVVDSIWDQLLEPVSCIVCSVLCVVYNKPFAPERARVDPHLLVVSWVTLG